MSSLGLHDKTLWDWLGLLIVPLVLAISVFLLNRGVQRGRDRRASERRQEQERRATERWRQKTLDDYFDRMSQLILTHRLLQSTRGDDVRILARARTLSALRGLDGQRRAAVVRFLFDAKLIQGGFRGPSHTGGVISLAGAELDDVQLAGAPLYGIDLSGASMRRANLRGAHIDAANLSEAVLADADMTGLDVEWIDLTGADLSGADLRGSRLMGVYLADEQMTAPELRAADIRRADPGG